MLLFFSEKNQSLLDIQEHCICKLGKIRSELKHVWCLLLIFKVVYWDHLTQLHPFAWDFIAKGQRLVWGQVGLQPDILNKCIICLTVIQFGCSLVY